MKRPLLVAGLMAATLACACGSADDHAGTSSASFTQGVSLDARAQVSAVYKRLAGVPAASADLDRWAAGLSAAADKSVYLHDVVARAATENDRFYAVTVLNFARSEASKEPPFHEADDDDEDTSALTDVTATIVGLVRDELDFREILSGDVLYVPSGATYSPTDNDAYARLHADVLAGHPLASSLTASTQSGATGLLVQAGIFTLRGFGSLYYDAGTNRAPVRLASIHYLCRDMEDLSDPSRADVFVRRDIDRAPGGDPSTYRTDCAGCHAGLDPLSSAFAYFDFTGSASGHGSITIASAPVAKVNRDADVFPGGAVVGSDAWTNLWLEGANASLGWDAAQKSGHGVKSLGEMLAATQMFPACMARRVYKTVCLKTGVTTADKRAIARLATEFSKDYDLKALFQDTAVTCALQ